MFGGGYYPTAFANSGLTNKFKINIVGADIIYPTNLCISNGNIICSPTDTPESV